MIAFRIEPPSCLHIDTQNGIPSRHPFGLVRGQRYKRYEFEGVLPETFAAFRAAFARGRYFNEHIRNCFRYHLLASDNDPG
ncbi:KTSC domain-containing protein [Mesorhizobium sp. M0833]|uniref:KTSC domain-containing protein n=1 Tax=Mesorhizobium sp. M0833 TaxID=2957009 RepID=UPI0033383488